MLGRLGGRFRIDFHAHEIHSHVMGSHLPVKKTSGILAASTHVRWEGLAMIWVSLMAMYSAYAPYRDPIQHDRVLGIRLLGEI